MMKLVVLAAQYLKGKSDTLGTSKNLVREVVVAILTAVGTYLILHLVMPPEPDVVGGLRDVLQATLKNQQRADSLETWILVKNKQDEIDSLHYQLRHYQERDSLRANGELSPMEAMRTIIGAIKGKKGK